MSLPELNEIGIPMLPKSEELQVPQTTQCKSMQGWDTLLKRFKDCQSPEQIANLFSELEIKGEAGDASSCAIAQFYKRYGGFCRLTVDECISFYPTIESLEEDEPKAQIHDLTRPMVMFIDAFDDKEYPDLLRK